MKSKEKINDEILAQKDHQSLLGKMSKKRRLKITKIQNDNTLSENEKQNLISQLQEDGMGTKRQKRS